MGLVSAVTRQLSELVCCDLKSQGDGIVSGALGYESAVLRSRDPRV